MVTTEQLKQWYIHEKLSYRDIMDKLGINNARKVRKLLEDNNIPIRRGSEAIKTQWENNEERRREIGKVFRMSHKGKPSPRRKTDKELAAMLLEKQLIFKGREIRNNYTYIQYICFCCGHEGETTLRSFRGCPKCALAVQHAEQKTSFKIVKKAFEDAGLILLATSYSNAHAPLPYVCQRHQEVGIQYRTYDKVKNSKGCKYCTYDSRGSELTTKNESIRNSWRMSKWRNAVFERDNYTCRCCGDNKGGNLHAHHIENFASNKELRFDINNGITLCNKCHNPAIKGSFHNIYGTYNNTREQLEEYIQYKGVMP